MSGNAEDNALEVHGLSKRFGGVVAVQQLSVKVKRGSITGLIGPNGSGKTTAFALISGVLPSDEGRVLLNDIDITGKRPDRIAKAGLLRTFQMTRVFSQMTVYENLVVRPGQRHASRNEALWELVELVGLDKKINEYAGDLSYGQQKLLELVRAASLNPPVMLLDEPFAGVNETMERHLVEFLRFMQRERDCSFFLIDHEMRLIMELCEHIYVMSNGGLICEGPPDVVRNDPATMEAYFGKGFIHTGEGR